MPDQGGQWFRQAPADQVGTECYDWAPANIIPAQALYDDTPAQLNSLLDDLAKKLETLCRL